MLADLSMPAVLGYMVWRRINSLYIPDSDADCYLDVLANDAVQPQQRRA